MNTTPEHINRSIRIFISSTFSDMMEERDAMMTHTWPELRKFCNERFVELVEVDLRWGITEEQSTRRETLGFCLNEIHACRPFFIGILGERYGWIPEDDAFTSDLKEEHPWIKTLNGRSITELEILHGVLNNPDMAGRTFFYFRDPDYSKKQGQSFLSESDSSAEKQSSLKEAIRNTCKQKNIPLQESYPNPQTLAPIVLEHLKAAIETQYPLENIPDPLDREFLDHEAFAKMRCRTYIGRPDYYQALNDYCIGDDPPLLLLGDSGSGKSALFANWVEKWRKEHPADFIFQHYIGGTSDSSSHWKLMIRLMKEIKRWTKDNDDLPRTNDDILKDFPLWLIKARIKAKSCGVLFIIILDAINQLEDLDRGRLLRWLPSHTFIGALRLMISTIPGDTLEVLQKRGWSSLYIQPLTIPERRQMIVDYLARYSKNLDNHRIERVCATSASENPLYLKILLDELRVTGTHDKLDERLSDYLSSQDIPELLSKLLARYKKDYDVNRKGLVGETMGFIWAARRGLTETELLKLLKPQNLSQLPLAIWTPLRSTLEEWLVNRGGILNFAHNFMRSAVETAFLPDVDKKKGFRLTLADFFESQPTSARNCDELPWLLWQTKSSIRLRNCLLNIDCFVEILARSEDELHSYWVFLNEYKSMGKPYLNSFNTWVNNLGINDDETCRAANALGFFLNKAAHHTEAEVLYRLNLQINENRFGNSHSEVAVDLSNLAQLLKETNRLNEAEPLMWQALQIHEQNLGKDHPDIALSLTLLAELLLESNHLDQAETLLKRAIIIFEKSLGENHQKLATCLNDLAVLFSKTNRPQEAELQYKKALQIDEHCFGKDHPDIARDLNNLALLFSATSRLNEAEPIFKRALQINEQYYGKDHPDVARNLNNLAQLFEDTNRPNEAEPLLIRAIEINEYTFGKNHPNVASCLNSLALLYQDTNRLNEAEYLNKRALQIDEQSYGKEHPKVALDLNNLAALYCKTNHLSEAEPLLIMALEINEKSFGKDHPEVGNVLINLAQLFEDTNRLKDAELLIKRALQINERSFGKDHPNVAICLDKLAGMCKDTNRIGEAELLMKRVLQIYEKSFGNDHPSVAHALGNLALLLQDTNHLNEAESLMIRALEINENNFGKNHHSVANALNNLATLYCNTDRLREAETLLISALEISEKSSGSDHPSVATTLSNLAMLYIRNNRIREAEPMLIRAIKINELSFGKDHPAVAKNLKNLALLLQRTSRLAEAEPLMKRALKINDESFGKDHPNVAASLNDLAILLQNIKRPEEAVPLIKRAIEIYEQCYGIDHPFLAISLNNLAGLFKDMNRMSEAEPLLIRGLEIKERAFGKDHPNVAFSLNNLATMYFKTNRLSEAEPLMKRVITIFEENPGENYVNLLTIINNLATLYLNSNRISEAEPLMKRLVEILIKLSNSTGNIHPDLQLSIQNYAYTLNYKGFSEEQILEQLRETGVNV